SAAGALDAAAALLEPGHDLVAVVALHFDDPVLGRAARAAQAFEVLAGRLELGRGEAVDDGHGAVAALLARHAQDAVVGHGARHRLRLAPRRGGQGHRPVGRVDQDPLVAHAFVLHAACNLEAMTAGSA